MKLYEQIALTSKHAKEKKEDLSSNYFSRNYQSMLLALKVSFSDFPKFFRDFAKPYKTRFKIGSDALSGFLTLQFLGLAIYAALSSVFSFFAIFAAPFKPYPKKFALDVLKSSSIGLISAVAFSLAATMYAAFWAFSILRIPVRLIITKFTDADKLLIENNKGYARLINIYDSLKPTDIETKKIIAATLIAKSENDIVKGQSTLATPAQISTIKKSYALFFEKNISTPQATENLDEKNIDHSKIVEMFRSLRSDAGRIGKTKVK